jgi:hypothetical protein
MRVFLRCTVFTTLVFSVLCFAAAPAALAQATLSGNAKAALTASHAAPQAERPSSGGMHEGVKVHGHWVIEVRSPKGKLLSHTEFENSLFKNNNLFDPQLPQEFLSRQYTVGEWGITLGDASASPCAATLPAEFGPILNQPVFLAFSGPFCVLSELGNAAIQPQNCGSASASGCSSNLQVAISNQFENLTLSGSVTVPNSGTISQVQTMVSTCGPTVSPAACAKETYPDNVGNDFLTAFTDTTLPQPGGACGGTGQVSCAVTVPEAGDTINVQVTISFQ